MLLRGAGALPRPNLIFARPHLIFMKTHTITLLLCMLFGAARPALADYDAAYAALQKKDYPSAVLLLKDAAALNDPKALHALGILHLDGLGVPKDEKLAYEWLEKSARAGNPRSMNMLASAHVQGLLSARKDLLIARDWAEMSAQTGDKNGRYLYYLTVLHGPEWNYRDEAGRVDQQKYLALANRSTDERNLDQKAYSRLALSAAHGDPGAQTSLISALLDKNGPGIKDRALAAIDAAPPAVAEKFRSTQRSLLALKANGESNTGLRMFMDVIRVAVPLAVTKGRLGGDSCDPSTDTKLVKNSVSRPLAGAEYLPMDVALLKDFYLIKGQWQELWEFSVCGKSVAVLIEFQADGLGGAYFQAKDAPLPVGERRVS